MSKVSKLKTGKDIEKSQPSAIRAWNPFEEMERMFENNYLQGWLHPLKKSWPSRSEMMVPFEGKMPKVDVIDRDGEIFVKAELPGVDKKDIDVSVTKNTVTIKGSARREEKEEKGDYYRCEISSESYSRTLSLPADINEDKVKAKYKDGVLELTLTKLNETKRREIKID